MARPTTIDECVQELDNLLKAEEKKKLLKTSKEDLIIYHHGLGRWIRNNWGLWTESNLFQHMKLLGFIHPDDMSSSLIREYWNRQHNLPSQIQEDIEWYKEYWENNGS